MTDKTAAAHALAQDALAEREAACAYIEDLAEKRAGSGYPAVATVLFMLARDIRNGKHHKGGKP